MANVKSIMVHENYGNMLHDLALLELQQPLIYSSNIQPIVIYNNKIDYDQLVTVAGWGLNKANGYISTTLQWSNFNVDQVQNCNVALFGEQAEESLLCLHSYQESGICNGDMGGAAMYEGKLIGIAAFTLQQCGGAYPDVFVNISYYLQWLRDNTDVSL